MIAKVCKLGHPMTPENTVRYANGRERCGTCKRDSNRRYYERKRRQLGTPRRRECRNGHRRTSQSTREVRRDGKVWRVCLVCKHETYLRSRERRRKLGWNQSSRLLRTYVAMAIGRRPRKPHEIARDVRDEYGSVSTRQVFRALAALRDAGKVRRVGLNRAGHVHHRQDEAGYVLARPTQTRMAASLAV